MVQKDIIKSWQFSSWQPRHVLFECLATEEDTQQSPGLDTTRTTPNKCSPASLPCQGQTTAQHLRFSSQPDEVGLTSDQSEEGQTGALQEL